MALSKDTTNAYNLKRAKRFADAGINAADVTYAHPEFLGIGDESCSPQWDGALLCSTQPSRDGPQDTAQHGRAK